MHFGSECFGAIANHASQAPPSPPPCASTQASLVGASGLPSGAKLAESKGKEADGSDDDDDESDADESDEDEEASSSDEEPDFDPLVMVATQAESVRRRMRDGEVDLWKHNEEPRGDDEEAAGFGYASDEEMDLLCAKGDNMVSALLNEVRGLERGGWVGFGSCGCSDCCRRVIPHIVRPLAPAV